MQQRQTAYKIWIREIINGIYHREEGLNPNYVLTNGKKISRVNIIATVIGKYSNNEKTLTTITLDDGSGKIDVKTFIDDIKILNDINIGDVILTIGKIRQNFGQMFILPEIVKKLDNEKWLTLRKIELASENGSNIDINVEKIEQFNGVEELITTETQRRKILDCIEKLDKENGADIEKVISLSKLNKNKAEIVIKELITEGEIFQMKPGRLRIT